MSAEYLAIEPIIGMEIHVQLQTRSKMFCGCRLEFGASPNSRVCPVCLGLPGALPVINRQAVHLAIRAGLALNCRIAELTKWDRKSYYYPDLPKNYQISQYDLPLASDGRAEYEVDGETREVRIRRAHLEEDAGKNIHDHPQFTRVDLNRAGTPLLEIVTEPDLHSAEECYAFATELQRLMVYLGVSEGVMKKAQMRFEPNINVRIDELGKTVTPICEVKNLNSFKSIRGAVSYEISRQVQAWQDDHNYTAASAGKENRGWDDSREVTFYQRVKEEAHDYRYFPDPDLPPVVIDAEWLSAVQAELPEMPLPRRRRLMQQSGLSAEDAAQIVTDRATAELFDSAAAAGANAKTVGKHFKSFWARHANDRQTTMVGLGVSAEGVAELARLQDQGRINATAAAAIAQKMLDCVDPPSVIAEREGLEQLQDFAILESMADQAIAENRQAVEIIQQRGKKWEKSLNFLQGKVMQQSKGSAAPQLVREILEKKLGLRD